MKPTHLLDAEPIPGISSGDAHQVAEGKAQKSHGERIRFTALRALRWQKVADRHWGCRTSSQLQSVLQHQELLPAPWFAMVIEPMFCSLFGCLAHGCMQCWVGGEELPPDATHWVFVMGRDVPWFLHIHAVIQPHLCLSASSKEGLQCPAWVQTGTGLPTASAGDDGFPRGISPHPALPAAALTSGSF